MIVGVFDQAPKTSQTKYARSWVSMLSVPRPDLDASEAHGTIGILRQRKTMLLLDSNLCINVRLMSCIFEYIITSALFSWTADTLSPRLVCLCQQTVSKSNAIVKFDGLLQSVITKRFEVRDSLFKHGTLIHLDLSLLTRQWLTNQWGTVAN